MSLAEISTVEVDGVEWQRHDYGGGLVMLQRECDAGCDGGLLLAPARFCSRCGGSGFLVRDVSAENPNETSNDG